MSDLCGRLGVKSLDETKLAKALKRLPGLGAGGPWIAGGAVRRTVNGESLDSDFDFFFANEKQADDFGIGRFRPRNNGYYGRFEVSDIQWSEA